MEYPADLHLHTTFSCDASASMANHADNAIEMGFKYVCFTEHFDANPADEGCSYYQPDSFFSAVEILQEQYGDRIHLLKGLEFAEPHLYPRAFDSLAQRPYDFILGSIHWLGDFFVLQRDRLAEFTPETLEERYYCELEAMTAFGGFDAVAHMDYLRRGTGRDSWPEDVVRRIFGNMVKNGIALEINTQHLRRGLPMAFPTPNLAGLYAVCGGSRITFGSDGHHPPDTASGIQQTYPEYASIPGLTPGIFIGRKFIPT